MWLQWQQLLCSTNRRGSFTWGLRCSGLVLGWCRSSWTKAYARVWEALLHTGMEWWFATEVCQRVWTRNGSTDSPLVVCSYCSRGTTGPMDLLCALVCGLSTDMGLCWPVTTQESLAGHGTEAVCGCYAVSLSQTTAMVQTLPQAILAAEQTTCGACPMSMWKWNHTDPYSFCFCLLGCGHSSIGWELACWTLCRTCS